MCTDGAGWISLQLLAVAHQADSNLHTDRDANADGDACTNSMQLLVGSAPLCLIAPGECLLPRFDGVSVYVGGGVSFSISRNDLLQYDPMNDSWTPLASSPDQHAVSQAVYSNGKLYNMGGFVNDLSHVSDTNRIYDIATNTWTTGAPMPAMLAAPATMLWNGVIYVAGGNYCGRRSRHALRL